MKYLMFLVVLLIVLAACSLMSDDGNKIIGYIEFAFAWLLLVGYALIRFARELYK